MSIQSKLFIQSNIKNVVNDIQHQLSSIKGNINIGITKSAATNLQKTHEIIGKIAHNLAVLTKRGHEAAAAFKSMNDAIKDVGKNLSDVDKSAKVSSSSLDKVSASTEKSGSLLEEFGSQAALAAKRYSAFTLAVGLGFAAFRGAKSAIEESIRFQDKLVKIAQVSERSLTQLKPLTNTISNLSASLGVSSEKLTDASLVLTQAGYTASQTEKALKALAKTELAPTFESIEQTTEGLIAIFQQFSIEVESAEKVLGSINRVSAQYAVESGDIVTAIRLAGSAFAALNKDAQGVDLKEPTKALNEFIATFTSIRATTRESANTIATGLKTIASRLQRRGTIEFFKGLGADLTDAEGKFIGFTEAIKKINIAIKDIDARDPRFAALVEELGGIRQINKTIPLLRQAALAQEAYNVAERGQLSLDENVVLSQQSIARQLDIVRESYLRLFREIGDTSTFKVLIVLFIEAAKAAEKMASAIKPLIPLIALLGAGKAISSTQPFLKGFANTITKKAGGGFIGGAGDRDSEIIAAMPGEFIVKKSAAKKLGSSFLNGLNKYADGGYVRKKGPYGPFQETSSVRPEGPYGPFPYNSNSVGTKTAGTANFADTMQAFTKTLADINRYLPGFADSVKLTTESLKDSRGRFRGQSGDKSVVLDPLKATVKTAVHEIGHALDYELGQKLGGKGFASSIPGSPIRQYLQTPEAQDFRKNYIAQLKEKGASDIVPVGHTKSQLARMTSPEEIFARIFESKGADDRAELIKTISGFIQQAGYNPPGKQGPEYRGPQGEYGPFPKAKRSFGSSSLVGNSSVTSELGISRNVASSYYTPPKDAVGDIISEQRALTAQRRYVESTGLLTRGKDKLSLVGGTIGEGAKIAGGGILSGLRGLGNAALSPIQSAKGGYNAARSFFYNKFGEQSDADKGKLFGGGGSNGPNLGNYSGAGGGAGGGASGKAGGKFGGIGKLLSGNKLATGLLAATVLSESFGSIAHATNPQERQRGAIGDVAGATASAGATATLFGATPYAAGAIALVAFVNALDKASKEIAQADLADAIKTKTEIARKNGGGNVDITSEIDRARNSATTLDNIKDNIFGHNNITAAGYNPGGNIRALQEDRASQAVKAQAVDLLPIQTKQIQAGVKRVGADAFRKSDEGKKLYKQFIDVQAKPVEGGFNVADKQFDNLVDEAAGTGKVLRTLETSINETVSSYKRLSDVLESAQAATKGFDEAISLAEAASKGQAGALSLTSKADLIRNPQKETINQFDVAVQSILDRVGKGGEGFDAKTVGRVSADIPNIVKQIERSSKNPDEVIEDYFKKLGRGPGTNFAKTSLLAATNNAEGFQSKTTSEKEEALKGATKGFLDALATLEDGMRKNGNELIATFARTSEALNNVGDKRFQASTLRAAGINKGIEISGRNGIGVNNVSAFNARQGDLAARGGIAGGGLDVQAIKQQILAVNAERERRAVTGIGDENSAIALNDKAAALNAALANLTHSVDLNTEIERQLSVINKAQGEKANFAEKIFTGNAQEKAQAQRAAALVQASRENPNFAQGLNTSDRKLLFQGTRDFENTIPEGGENLRKRILSLENPGLFNDKEKRRLENKLRANFDTSSQAIDAQADIEETGANSARGAARKKFSTVNSAILGDFNKTFKKATNDLTKALSSIPKEIELKGTIALNVNVNGAEAFGNMTPAIKQLVDARIQQGLNQLTKNMRDKSAGPGVPVKDVDMGNV